MVSIGNSIKREAGLLLLGGIIFGSSSMLKAAEKYVDDPNNAAVSYYNIFCHELGNEVDKRRNDLKYADKMYMLDLMLEETFYPYGLNYDTTIQYRDEMEDFMTDILKDALSTTLEQTDIYRDVKNDLQSDLRGLFGLPEVHKARTSGTDRYPVGGVCFPGMSWEGEVKPEPPNNEAVGNGLLGYGKVDTGVRSSLSSDEVRLSAHAKFEDLRLLGARFDNGKIEVSTKNKGRLRATLRNVMSKKMQYSFFLNSENMDDPSTNVGVDITGGKENEIWEVSAGYGDDIGVFATARLVKRF